LIELIGTAVTLGIAGGGSKTTFCIPQIMAKAVAAISGYGMPACGLRGKVKRAIPVRVVAVSSVSIAPPRTGLSRTE
jgi:hypothetical protein